MRRSLFSIVTGTALLAGASVASADTTTTTTTWTPEQGTTIREYSTTRHYNSWNDPAFKPSVGVVVPQTVTAYPLPETVTIPQRDTYSYSIINNQPVVIERGSRKVIHAWD
ncbi:MAG: DUF1236 domain-containing protein [Acetobacteraceae bacterium]